MTAQVHEAAFSFDRLFGIEMQNALQESSLRFSCQSALEQGGVQAE